MKRMTWIAALATGVFGLLPSGLGAQSFDVTGARAAGMGGAFVAVADDASALYWNPAGLAAGSYFSLVLDASARRAVPPEGPHGNKQSSFFLGLTTPVLGLAYYRLHSATAEPYALLLPTDGASPSRNLTGAPDVRVNSLTTHHAGVTLVQSILPSVAVGATLKMVRGFAGSAVMPLTTAKDVLDTTVGQDVGGSRFDVDLGIMATSPRLKAGVTLRNLREPEFSSADGTAMKLERQVRAGLAWSATTTWVVAADMDVLTTRDAFGDRRDAALGVEGKVARRATIRSGVKLNLAGSDAVATDGRAAGLAAGGSFAVTPSVWLDGVAVIGGDRAGRGWGVSARFVY